MLPSISRVMRFGGPQILFKYLPGMDIAAMGGSYTGASLRTYIDQQGVLQYAAANLCLRSEEFSNAAWSVSHGGGGSDPVVTADQTAAPDGNTTADKIVFAAPVSGDNSFIQSTTFNAIGGVSYTGSVYVKAFAAGDIGKIIAFRHAAGSPYTLVTLTSDWQRVSSTETGVGAAESFIVALRPSVGTSTGTVSVYLWGAQVEVGTTATGYKKTTSAVVSAIRDKHYINGVGPLTLLEGARTNLCTFGYDLSNAAWTLSNAGAGSNPVVTGNSGVAPDGYTTAAKVVFAAPGAGDESAITSTAFSVTATSTYTGSIWIKAFAAGDVGKTVLFRGVAASAYTSVVLTANWQRVSAAEVAVGSSRSFLIQLRPSSGSSSGTVSCYLWGAQVELGAFASSTIPTLSGSVARTADTPVGVSLAPPNACTLYFRGIWSEGAVDGTTNYQLFLIGPGTAATAYLLIRIDGATLKATAQHNNGGGASSTSATGTALNIGDTYEVWAFLDGGTGAVTVGLSVNGGPLTVSAASSVRALATAWGSTNVYLGTLSSGGQPGYITLQAALMVSGYKSFSETQALAK